MLPECKSIRGKLKKFEVSQKQFQKYCFDNTQKQDFTESHFLMKDAFKTTKLKNKNLERCLSEFGSPQRPVSVKKTWDGWEEKFLTMVNQKDQEIQKLKDKISKLKNINSENISAEILSQVSKFEWKECKWLIWKENFSTHLSFCQEKQKSEISIDDMVKITLAPEPKIKHSFSTEVLQDFWNTYDKSEKNELNLPRTSRNKRSLLTPFPLTVERKSTQIAPLKFYENKENTSFDTYM